MTSRLSDVCADRHERHDDSLRVRTLNTGMAPPCTVSVLKGGPNRRGCQASNAVGYVSIQTQAFRSPFQGEVSGTASPGLKAWVILSGHFMATANALPRWDSIIENRTMNAQTGDVRDFLSIKGAKKGETFYKRFVLCVLCVFVVNFLPYSRSAVIGLIRRARSVGIRQAKVAARASTIMTNPIVIGS
jgi:hypothetical protein